MFPSLWQILRYHHVGVLIGPLLLGVGVINLVWFVRLSRRQKREGGPTPYRPALFAVVAFIIGSASFLGVYGSIWNAWRVRAEAGRIAEISVERLATEGQQPAGLPVVISDRKLIAEGFARLQTATGQTGYRDNLSDGYRIRLKLDGEAGYADRYLSVYRTSGRSRAVAVVIPHFGPSHAGRTHHGGEYSCPAFLDWVNQNIEPRFRERERSGK